MADRVESCPYRKNVRRAGPAERAECHWLLEMTGLREKQRCEVTRDVCRYCAPSGIPSGRSMNPVAASRLYALASDVLAARGMPGCDEVRAAQLRALAEANLDSDPAEVDCALNGDRSGPHCLYLGSAVAPASGASLSLEAGAIVYECSHPSHLRTTLDQCAGCRDWVPRAGEARVSIERLLPVPAVRSESVVRRWEVGVTTAPRRRPTLGRTLDALRRAGWDHPHLFVDGDSSIPARFATLPATVRHSQVGEWPNFYLGLCELFMRNPDADAYMMMQDDAEVYDRENLRNYLESFLWPGERPCPISLYSAHLDVRAENGWFPQKGNWFRGGLAFVFPRSVVIALLRDETVISHCAKGGAEGRTGVDSVVGAWAYRNGSPIYAPTPSLCRHIGDASAIWVAGTQTANRQGGIFAGDVHDTVSMDRAQSPFPESRFPSAPEDEAEYRERVETGYARMRTERAVLVGLCRDVRPSLPLTAARLEALGTLFGDYRIVLLEHDSVDGTFAFLRSWSHESGKVHVLSTRTDQDLAAGDSEEPYPRRRGRLRERSRRYIVEHHCEYESVIVVDFDALGGWSLDGVAHTFGHDHWDFVGGYGLLSRTGEGGTAALVHFDPLSYRPFTDQRGPSPNCVGPTGARRGGPLLRVASCFGGLAVYRMNCMRFGAYDGDDACEHAALHRSLQSIGLDRLFLNPSQIVLYSDERDA